MNVPVGIARKINRIGLVIFLNTNYVRVLCNQYFGNRLYGIGFGVFLIGVKQTNVIGKHAQGFFAGSRNFSERKFIKNIEIEIGDKKHRKRNEKPAAQLYGPEYGKNNIYNYQQ